MRTARFSASYTHPCCDRFLIPTRAVWSWWDQLLKLGRQNFPNTFATFADYRERNQVFDDMAAYQPADMNLAAGDDSAPPERLPALQVSANLFPMLGVQPLHGRLFTASDNQPGRDRIAVLSHALWRRRSGSDPRVIGGTLTLDGKLFTVAGVLPPEFAFAAASAELYTPIAFEADPLICRPAGRRESIRWRLSAPSKRCCTVNAEDRLLMRAAR